MAAAVGACVSRALEAGSANVSEEGSGAELEVDVPEAGSLAIEEPAVGSGASRAWAHGGEEPPLRMATLPEEGGEAMEEPRS